MKIQQKKIGIKITKKKIKSYMSPNPHLKYLDLQSKKINRSLPILKNGSRGSRKVLQIKGYRKIVLTNTCAFDTAVFLIMVAMYDSEKYLKLKEETHNSSIFIKCIKKILSKGITVDTYRERTAILIDLQKPIQTPLKYNQTLLKCETTFNNLLKCVMPDLSTIFDSTECTDSNCNKMSYKYLTYLHYDGNFNELEKFIYELTCIISSICEHKNGNNTYTKIKTLTSFLPNQPLFIEIIQHDEGECV